jgi:tetratricopeptide (TPR) repeat protein
VEGARFYYLKAAQIAHELAAADPANRIAKYDLASVELRLGALDPEPGSETESLASLTKARQMFEELVKAEPQVLRYQSPLALAHQYIGIRLRAAGKPAEALAELKTSVAVAEKALSTNPSEGPAQAWALASEQEIAGLLAATGDRDGAIDYARRAVARAERNSRTLKAIPSSQILLAKAYMTMATIQRQLKNWPQARQAATQAELLWRRLTGNRKDDAHAEDLVAAEQFVADCDTHFHPSVNFQPE